MKIVLDQGALLSELTLLQGVIEKKSTVPILSCVLLNATEDGRLHVSGTDLDVGFRSSVAATVEVPGTMVVHARRLYDVVRKLPPGNVGMREKGSSLHLHCEKTKYRLAANAMEEFPGLRNREGKPAFSIQAAMLEDMIRRVLPAIAIDDPRYSLDGALWKVSDGMLTMVATDGHRLTVSKRPLSGPVATDVRNMIVPRKALVEIQRLASGHEGPVEVWSGDGHLFGSFGQREVSTTLKEREFPDFERVVEAADGCEKTLEVDTKRLRQAIERVAVLSQEHTHLVKLEVEGEVLRLSATHSEFGEAEDEISAEFDGETHSMGFNAQYLLDVLSTAGTEKVRVRFGDGRKQGLFSPLRPDDDDLLDVCIIATLGN